LSGSTSSGKRLRKHSTCVLPVEFWHLTNCENRCVTLLRNSNTQHWVPVPFQPPTFGKSSTPYPESLPCQDDIDSCHSSMPTDGTYAVAECGQYKSRLHIHTPGAPSFGRNRHLPWIRHCSWSATDWRSPPSRQRDHWGCCILRPRCLLGWRVRSCFPPQRCGSD
jgi:hypothetical protein